jgi:hypothetical protein
VESSIVLTREDQSEVLVGAAQTICCGNWEPGAIQRLTVKVFFYDPGNAAASWKLFLLLDDVTAGETYSFPTASSNVPEHLFLFVNDVTRSNELASDVQESFGTVRVDVIECGPPLRLDVTVDVTLGSEVSLPSVRAAGRLRATVTPVPIQCDFGI